MLGGVRKDGQLRAAKKSQVVHKALLRHSQPQLHVVPEVTDEDISSGNGTPAGEWKQR